MSSKFEQAVAIVLVNEGGYTNDPEDHGGETHWGITWADLKSAIAHSIVSRETTVIDLTKAQAIDIYKAFYWNALKLDRIETQSIATKIFDTSVNLGLHWGVITLQRAVRASTGKALKEDGILGPRTLEAVNNAPPGALLAAMRSEQAGYYRCIIIKNPSQICFENGWSRRAYD